MGLITSCCRPSASDVLTPDAETRRQQQMAAAERRRQEEAARGVKDSGRLQRIQKKTEEMEKREQELEKDGGPALKWTAN